MPDDFKMTRKDIYKARRAAAYQQNKSAGLPVCAGTLQAIMRGGLSQEATLAICLLLVAGACVGTYMHMQTQGDAGRRHALVPQPPSAASSSSTQSAFAFFNTVGGERVLWKPQWYQDVIQSVNATCHKLRTTSGLRPFNNAPYFREERYPGFSGKRWVSFPKEIETSITSIHRQIRDIKFRMTNTVASTFKEELERNRRKIENELASRVDIEGCSQEEYDINYAVWKAPVYEYFRLILMLIELHVNEAVVKLIGGGLSREFASLSALAILRDLDELSLPRMPSINITTLSHVYGEDTPHAMVRVRQEEPKDYPEEKPFYCDPWLHPEQGQPFFEGMENHFFMRGGVGEITVEAGAEVGRTPDLSAHPAFIREIFERWRKRCIHESFQIPKEEMSQLEKLGSALRFNMGKADARFDQDKSLSTVREKRMR
ncbi:hypothetical protein [Legionella sp. CNM-4043-24]|uniref:hypothetical protein n=1 Tax=Legionella sp. CNM-4043-24 TaxID=3421646 RepID=UPI00403AB325